VGGPVAPYIQSERRDTYGKYAHLLVERGHAYYCFCEKTESEEDSGNFSRAADPCRALSQEEIDANLLAGMPYVIRQRITYFMGLSDQACEALREAAITLGYMPEQLKNGAYGAYEQIYLSNFISQHWSGTDWHGIEGVGDQLIQMHYNFLGVDLSVQPTAAFSNFKLEWGLIGLILIPVLAAGLQYFQTILMNKSNGQSQQQASMKMLNLTMPLMSLWFCFVMPAALGVYWIANSVFLMIQEPVLGKFYTDKLNAEEDERAAKRDAERKLRMEEAKKRAAEQREQDAKRPKKQPQKSGDKKPPTTEAGRVGERPYARGRSYRADRYDEKE